jgi:hypothetical protein
MALGRSTSLSLSELMGGAEDGVGMVEREMVLLARCLEGGDGDDDDDGGAVDAFAAAVSDGLLDVDDDDDDADAEDDVTNLDCCCW